MQVAESSNLQHQGRCKLLDSAGWVPILPSTYLKEFVALHYERNPESMRTVPWLRSAGRDSAPRLRLRVPIVRDLDRGNAVSTSPNIAKVL